MQGYTLKLAAVLLLCTSAALGGRTLLQQDPQPPPELPGTPAVASAAKSFFQNAMQDVFSALGYSGSDQQKITASPPKPQPGASSFHHPSHQAPVPSCVDSPSCHLQAFA